MRRILLFFCVLALFAGTLAAQSVPGDEYDPGDEYEPVEDVSDGMNRRGDQYIKIGIMPNFPLNFDGQLYIGGAFQLAYFRYLNGWLALGGDLTVGYNTTLGSNVLMFVPLMFGVSFAPSVWRFEFPVSLAAGIAFETYQNRKYFPGFAGKVEAGAFFRLSESWSFGLGSDFLYLPQWYVDDSGGEADYGLFLTAFVAARYHF